MQLIGAWRKTLTAPPLQPGTSAIARDVKGFLGVDEGTRLYELAYDAAGLGPCVEIGSYCGKSALFIGEGCRTRGGYRLFSIDHHRGSEEQQRGQEYFDPDLYDAARGRVDTLPHFLANIARAGLEDWIIPVVGRSDAVALTWPHARLGVVFVDGGHAKATVERDVELWGRFVVPGGWLCVHDVYPNPADGGRAPFEVFEAERASRRWRFEGLVGSLGVLRRRR
jgi:predicted O-methyltransferase YrrM